MKASCSDLRKSWNLIWLCKGWYRQDIFDTTLQAIRVNYKHRCGITVTDEDIYQFLVTAASEVFDKDNLIRIMRYALPEAAHRLHNKYYSMSLSTAEYPYFQIDLLISELALLTVRLEDGSVIFGNNSMSEEVFEYISSHNLTVDSYKPLTTDRIRQLEARHQCNVRRLIKNDRRL